MFLKLNQIQFLKLYHDSSNSIKLRQFPTQLLPTQLLTYIATELGTTQLKLVYLTSHPNVHPKVYLIVLYNILYK